LHGDPPNLHRPLGRRALSHVGGELELRDGTQEQCTFLRRALSVLPEDESSMEHVHGFHSYPARMHPQTARELVLGCCKPGQLVLDPFSGSGTVLVEARLAGRMVCGLDANPLAVALQNLKVLGCSDAARANLLSTATAIADAAEERRLARAGATRRYPGQLAMAYDPHVLLELDGISSQIGQLEQGWLRSALGLVLSSMLTKVSRRQSDTSDYRSARRIAGGFVIRLFRAKSSELSERLARYHELLGPNPPRADLRLGDARRIPFPPASARAIITSPPYPGVYDYVDHHSLRLQWLGLSSRFFEDHEIGARRHTQGMTHEQAVARWHSELGACLAECRRVLQKDGTIALVLADSVVADQAWYAEDAVALLAPRIGLRIVARASQLRPHFHRPTARAFFRRPRHEHVILLRHL
jgi:hypothetical protein